MNVIYIALLSFWLAAVGVMFCTKSETECQLEPVKQVCGSLLRRFGVRVSMTLVSANTPENTWQVLSLLKAFVVNLFYDNLHVLLLKELFNFSLNCKNPQDKKIRSTKLLKRFDRLKLKADLCGKFWICVPALIVVKHYKMTVLSKCWFCSELLFPWHKIAPIWL